MISIEALIFDMDGLMIDSERLYFQTQREIAARFGRQVPEPLLWSMMGRKPIESLRLFAEQLQLPMCPEELLQLRNGIMREKLRSDLKTMPGLEEILSEFSGKCRLAIATGAQQEFMDIVVDALKIRAYFSVLQSSDNISRGKPDPEIYQTACARLALPPAKCLVLEDAANGVVAAKAAGCRAIAVPSAYSRGQDFSLADEVAVDLFAAANLIRQRMGK